MHEHFADTFNAIEFGIRFEERSRLDEVGSSPKVTAAKTSPAAQDHADSKAEQTAGGSGKQKVSPNVQDHVDKQEATKPDTTATGSAKKGASELKKSSEHKGFWGGAGTAMDQAVSGVVDGVVPVTTKLIAESVTSATKDIRDIEKAQKSVVKALLNDPKGAKAFVDAQRAYEKNPNAGNAGDVIDAYVKYGGDLADRVAPAVVNAGIAQAQATIDFAGQIVKATTAPQMALLSGVAGGVTSAVTRTIDGQRERTTKMIDTVKEQVNRTNQSRDDFGKETAQGFVELGAQVRADRAAVKDGGWFAQAGGNLDAMGHAAAFEGRTAVNYVTRAVQAQVESVGTVAKLVGDAVTNPFHAAGDFFGGLFGGGSAQSKDGAHRVGAGSHGKPKDDKEADPTADNGSAASASHHGSADSMERQAVADAKSTDATPHGSADANERKAVAKARAAAEAAEPGAAGHRTSDAQEHQAQIDARTPKAIDYATPANQAVVAKAATEAHLIARGTTFNASGAAVHAVERGDGYWNIVGQYSADGQVDTKLWLDAQAVNGNMALDPGDSIIIPGRGIDDL
ncbi:MAG: hypothetical protein H7287_11155, partial [Thermoleophilia bacterium]|nr:hypothetical protein [Thermoleophilia bacterium]